MEREVHSREKEAVSKEPLLSPPPPLPPPRGGLRTIPFILANEALEKVASYGLLPNMILYLTREYGMEAAAAAKVLYFWSAATNFAPVIGAFLADSCVGRFRMIGFGSIISLLGMTLLWSTTLFPQARPPHCDEHHSNNTCQIPTIPQLSLLYSSFAFMSVGAGGIRSSCLPFGADQLTANDRNQNPKLLEGYFRWYYASVMVAALLAETCIVYIQANLGWKIGFGVPVAMMLLSIFSFFLASPFYIQVKPDSGVLTGLIRVVVAAYRNRGVKVPPGDTDGGASCMLYHHKKDSSFLIPSEKLRFLNKACATSNIQQHITLNGNATDPWKLCTVDEVESLKSVISVIPIWSTGIMLAVSAIQGSFIVLEANSMDRQILPNFKIPSGSLGVFLVISFVTFLALYEHLILCLISKIRGKDIRPSLKQRMGFGLLLSAMAVGSLAIMETFRRKIATTLGFTEDPRAHIPMSAMWILLYESMLGIGEALNAIAQNEFYYTELPKAMASVASTLCGLGMSCACLVSSLIVSVVDGLSTKFIGESWVSSNINKGHLDYYYWVVAGMCLVNFGYFVVCSRAYGEEESESEEVVDEEGGITENMVCE